MSPKPDNVSHMAEQMDMKKRKEIMKNMYRQGIAQTLALPFNLNIILLFVLFTRYDLTSIFFEWSSDILMCTRL